MTAAAVLCALFFGTAVGFSLGFAIGRQKGFRLGLLWSLDLLRLPPYPAWRPNTTTASQFSDWSQN